MNLRIATADDIPAIAYVFIEARTRCLAFLNWEYSQEVMERVYTAKLQDLCMTVAEVEGRIAGFVTFGDGEVDDLYVLPEFHQQGIGSALLSQAKSGARELRLWVFQANLSARAFYEARGFELLLETDGSENMEKCPDARYVWRASAIA